MLDPKGRAFCCVSGSLYGAKSNFLLIVAKDRKFTFHSSYAFEKVYFIAIKFCDPSTILFITLLDEVDNPILSSINGR